MYVIITTEAGSVEVSDGNGEGYHPEVMNDLCARAVTTTIDAHRKFIALDIESKS